MSVLSTAEATGTGFSGSQRWSIFISAILGFALDGYNLLMLSFLILPISKTFHVSLAGMGFVFSLQLIFSMIGGPIFGWLADVRGRKSALMYSILVYSLGALLSAVAPGFAVLAIARALTGLGLGGEWGVGMALFNEAWTPRWRATGGGVIQSSFLIGILAASQVMHWSMTAYGPDLGWRVALGTGGLPVLLVLFVRWVMPESILWSEYDGMRRAGRLPSDKAHEKAPVAEIFRGRALGITIIGLLMVGCYMYSFYGMSTFFPTLLAKQFHVPGEIAGIITAATAISIPIYWLIGVLGDVVGRKAAFIPFAILEVIGIAWFGLVAGLNPVAAPAGGSFWGWPVFWSFLLFYIGSGSFAVFGVWFSEIYTTELRSTGVSTAYMIGRGISGVVPLLVPLLAVAFHASLVLGMVTGAVTAVVLAILPIKLRETRGKQLQAIERIA